MADERKKAGPDGWQRLVCSCGTDRFAAMKHLRWRAGSGMTEEPAGFFCLECHAKVQASDMIAKVQMQMKRQELRPHLIGRNQFEAIHLAP